MTDSCEFDSLLNNETRDVLDCVVDVGIRTWPPSGVHATTDDGLVHLFYVLEGILACQRRTHLTRVLPRELLRIGHADKRKLENPSRSDSTLAVQITLTPEDETPIDTRHIYFSDDQKNLQLCRVAGFGDDPQALMTRAPVELFLTTLGRYDTLRVERDEHQPLLVLCVRGKATLNTVPLNAKDPAAVVEARAATIVGTQPCTLITLRGARSRTSR